MGSLLNIGFGNMVNAGKIVAIISPDSAPAKRMVQAARESGKAVDGTQGRRTRAVLVMDNDYIVLSALQPETIANRYKGKAGYLDEYETEEKDSEVSEG